MKTQEDRVEVRIFGQQYTLRGSANADYTHALARYVDQRMQEVAAQSPLASPGRIAILAAINITHELFQSRKKQKDKEAAIGERTKDLIESIEEQFEEFRLEYPASP